MYLLLNVFITHKRTKNIANRLDIFKYTLSSYSVISWEQVILNIELDDEFLCRKQEIETFIYDLFEPRITVLNWKRCAFQVEWVEMFKTIDIPDTKLVWFSQNDDHPFVDFNLDILNEGVSLLSADTSQFKTLYYSHWIEILKLSGKLGNCERIGNYVKFTATLCDSIQIMNIEYLKYLLLELDWQCRKFIKIDDLLTQKQIVGRTCGLYSTTDSIQTIYVPLRELCRHFEGYEHVGMDGYELSIPEGFFENSITSSVINNIPLFWKSNINNVTIVYKSIKEILQTPHTSLWNNDNTFETPDEWIEIAQQLSTSVQTPIKTSVICHFYNEEYLLPFWLEHHKRLFDYGLMIDYNSTDRSVEIIKSICPNWDIVPSRNDKFVSDVLGIEVQDYEESILGWKMVVNVTEFICPPEGDLKKYLANFEDTHPYELGFWTPVYTMVDSYDNQYTELNPHEPLIKQRYHGFYNTQYHNRCCRLIHKDIHGFFDHGRHSSIKHRFIQGAPSGIDHPSGISSLRQGNKEWKWKPFGYQQDFFILWYGFSPFTARQILRTWQKSEKIIETYHLENFKNIENYIIQNFHRLQTVTSDLRDIYPNFKTYWDNYENYNVEQINVKIEYPKLRINIIRI
jgi:hypothetical protein